MNTAKIADAADIRTGWLYGGKPAHGYMSLTESPLGTAFTCYQPSHVTSQDIN